MTSIVTTGLLKPLRELASRPSLDQGLHSRVRTGGEEDAAVGGLGAKARSQVDDAPDRGVVDPVTKADAAKSRVSRRYPDPEPQLETRAAPISGEACDVGPHSDAIRTARST